MKLRKLGYSSGLTVKIGRVADNDAYPRWGYTERLEANPVLPKALIVSLAFLLGMVGLWSGWKTLQAATASQQLVDAAQHSSRSVRMLRIADLQVPPSLTPDVTAAARVDVQTRPKIAIPKPVSDEIADQETIARVDEMAYEDDQLPSAWDSDDRLIVDAIDTLLPRRGAFVVFQQPPVLVSMEPPRYSEIAREARLEGEVELHLLVGRDGLVQDVRVIRSVLALDPLAVEAGWTAVFKPALQGDHPVAVWMSIQIDFILEGT